MMSITFLCFALLDCGAKWLVQTLPVLMVVWLRFLFHAVFSVALMAPKLGSGALRTKRLKMQLFVPTSDLNHHPNLQTPPLLCSPAGDLLLPPPPSAGARRTIRQAVR